MALGPGVRLGPYEILALLGAGGMGEVYRARDTKLNRDVALKILSDTFTHDRERLARFRREAQILAALNHANIGTIYGLDEANGQQFLVLELVNGESLDRRIARGPIPIDQALTIAKQIAEALEAAHEKGIVHRDLKPANIAVTKDGQAKVLDFGLAKTTGAASGASIDLESSPTLTSPAMMTGVGVILGTAAYMSPEQARGRAVDKRTDVWAFGCVVYEILTGRRAFPGETLSDTLAAILERDPDWRRLGQLPPGIERLLRHCLEKDAKRRLHDIADARIEIEDALSGSTPQTEGAAPLARNRIAWIAAVAALVLALAAAGAVILSRSRHIDGGSPIRLSISVPGQLTPQLSAAVSPDGRRVAFVSTDTSGRSMLWVRSLDTLDAHVLAGTEDAAHPFWSPDGRTLGFAAGGRLKRVDAAGGVVQTLADSIWRSGAAWSDKGVIVFSPRAGEFATVPDSGGAIVSLPFAGSWPSFLPDGRHFLFYGRIDPAQPPGICVGSTDSHDTARLLLTSDFKGQYALPGYLLSVRDHTLLAQPFDAQRQELTGQPVAIAEGIWTAFGAAQASFSVSRTGTLAYVNASLTNTELDWVGRDGAAAGSLGTSGDYADEMPQISPDRTRILIARGALSNRQSDIWLVDVRNGTTTRQTFRPGANDTPVWSAESGRFVYQFRPLDSRQPSMLVLKTLNGGAEESLLQLDAPTGIALWDWSRDGRVVVYSIFSNSQTRNIADLWMLPLDSRVPRPYLETPFHKTQAQLSPDGHWIAYTSYESGRDEVYVQSFPGAGNKYQVSVDGGVMPRWRRDGTELFYLAANQNLVAVPIRIGSTLDVGRSTSLFKARIIPQGSQSIVFNTLYDVSADGQRFLLNVPPVDPGPPITVVLNWTTALGRP